MVKATFGRACLSGNTSVFAANCSPQHRRGSKTSPMRMAPSLKALPSRGSLVWPAAAFVCVVFFGASAIAAASSGNHLSPRVGIDTSFGDRLREGGKAYNEKNYARAAALFSSALDMHPDPKNATLAYAGRAYSNMLMGNYRAAAADYEKLKVLLPRNPQVLNSAAWLYATCLDAGVRNGKRAVQDATAACQFTAWKHSYTLDTLAAAYAEAGEFDRAVEFQARAINAAPFAERAAMQGRLELYKNRMPYRDQLKR